MKGLIGSIRMHGGVWAAMFLVGLAATQAQQPASSSATPDQGPLQRLTLADAQHLAFERNWDLLAAAAGVDAATAQKIVARQFPNPTVSQYTRSEEHTSE